MLSNRTRQVLERHKKSLVETIRDVGFEVVLNKIMCMISGPTSIYS